jgi:hypothetical protein
MGDQLSAVRFLNAVLDLLALPRLDVEVLVNSCADDSVAGAVQRLRQGVKLLLLFRGDVYYKDAFCHREAFRDSDGIICNLSCRDEACKRWSGFPGHLPACG